MSDYGDEMEVDVPPIASSLGEGTKGKRSAANLPVEAEDSLPWFVTVPLPPSMRNLSRC